MSRTDIRLEQICTREDILAGYSQSGKGEKALAILDEHGVFPATYANPTTEIVTVLGLYTYLSGSLTINQLGGSNGTIAGGLNQRDLQEEWRETLGLELKSYGNDCHFSKNGGAYTRLLAAMGFHTVQGKGSSKRTRASTGSVFPRYLTRLVDDYETFTRTSKRCANRLLRDLIAVWFDTKSSMARNTSVRVYLIAQPTMALLEEQAHFFVNAMALVYPGVGVSKEDLNAGRPYKFGKQLSYYAGSFLLTMDHLLGFHEYGNPPISLRAEINPKFQFEVR